MRKRTVVIAAITVITIAAVCKGLTGYYSSQEKDKVIKTLYRLDRRPYDETVVEEELYREWLKQTAVFSINTTENSEVELIDDYLKQQGIDKSIPDIVTYYKGEPFIQYYEDEQSGKAVFTAILSYDDSPFKSVYCGAAYIEDFKKEGSLVYDFDQSSRLLSEQFYNSQGEQIASTSYEYREDIPFPVITNYDNVTWKKGRFYSNVYLNTGQRFWVYDSLLEFDESGRWSKYNGNIYNDSYAGDGIERYNTPVYNEEGRLQEIVQTIRGSHYQDNPDEWIEDGNIAFLYHDNGSLAEVSYDGFSGSHGSSANTGIIFYDENERVVYINSYHSLGNYEHFFLYQNDESNPYAIFRIGKKAYSGENFDDYNMIFGMDFDAWLFLEE